MPVTPMILAGWGSLMVATPPITLPSARAARFIPILVSMIVLPWIISWGEYVVTPSLSSLAPIAVSGLPLASSVLVIVFPWMSALSPLLKMAKAPPASLLDTLVMVLFRIWLP